MTRTLTLLVVALAVAFSVTAQAWTVRPMAPGAPEELRVPPDPKTAPRFPSEPVPGYPGANPEHGSAKKAMGAEWRKDIYNEADTRPPWGWPELQNYPGSIEHYRRADMNMLPCVLNRYNDRTLVVNRLAVDLPGVPAAAKETFAEPEYYVMHKWHPPGYKKPLTSRAPVPVVRLKAAGPRLAFDLGPLPTSMYCVRLIAATETKDCRDARPMDLIVDMKVNDGPNGEISHYVLRQKPVDLFYSFGEFYFHVVDDRPIRVDVGLHPTSKVDLLVHNVDVHDILKECARAGAKKRSILTDRAVLEASWQKPAAAKERERFAQWRAARLAALQQEFPRKTAAETAALDRRRRDDIIWHSLPPINSHYTAGTGTVASRPDAETEKALKTQGVLPLDNIRQPTNGNKWDPKAPWNLDLPLRAEGGMLEKEWGQAPMQWTAPWRLVWEKPGGETAHYTLADLAANKPLPGLPFEVFPWGRRFEDEAGNASCFFPIAQRTAVAYARALAYLQNDRAYAPLQKYCLDAGVEETTWDMALLLCRVAWDAPSLVAPHDIIKQLSGPEDHVWRVGLAHRHRNRNYQYVYWNKLALTYDRLFDFIKNNDAFAAALGRYIPWVRTPADVVTLLDTHIIQYGARETMYYQYYFGYEHPQFLALFAAVQADKDIARPWLEMLFSRAWVLFSPPASIEDILYSSTQRDGTPPIGSFFYAQGGRGAMHTARWLEHYLRQDGDARYDLTDRRRYPRVTQIPMFQLEAGVAGLFGPQVGDVGPNAAGFGGSELMHDGWRWFRDPRFAWVIVNLGKRLNETDAEWAEIEAAAKTVTRDPFFDKRSRVLSDWMGALEGGVESDDPRFRHAATVRVGWGTGHAHHDALDLGVYSLGLSLTPDHGQRPGYGSPEVGVSYLHNVASVGRSSFGGHSWVSELADMGDCQYLRARGTYQQRFERQVALVEVDKGREPNSVRQPKLPPSSRRVFHPPVAWPRAYVVDVFRIAGGDLHSYNCHGAIEDDFQADVERRDLTEADRDFLKSYLLDGQQWGGDVAVHHLTLTWLLSRERKTFVHPKRGERKVPYLGDPAPKDAPRKFLRIHVLGQKGSRFLSGLWVAAPYGKNRKDGHRLRQAHVLRRPDDPARGSLFAAVYEPYVAEPFIKGVSFEGDPGDAAGLAAVRVETVDGVRDLCFADDTADVLRTLKDGTQIQARFALVSRDEKGLRMAAVVGGRALRVADFAIRPLRDEWRGKVADVNYLDKTLTLDAALPATVLTGAFFEVGAAADGPHQAKWTNYQAARVTPGRGASTLVWKKDSSAWSGRIEEVGLTADAPYAGRLSLNIAPKLKPGENHQLVLVSPASGRRFQCDVKGRELNLYGAAVTGDDFQVGQRVVIQNFGPGYTWRRPTRVSLRRQEDGVFRIEADTGFELALRARAAARSMDGRAWTPLPAGADGFVRLRVADAELSAGVLFLKAETPAAMP